MVVEQRRHASGVDTATAAPTLPRQYVAKQEVRATRKRKPPRRGGRVAVAVSVAMSAGLVLAAVWGGQSGTAAPAVSSVDASATVPIEYEGWRLNGVQFAPDGGEFAATASITWTGQNGVVSPQDFVITVFQGHNRVGELSGSVPKAVPGREMVVEFGSTNAFAAGANRIAFRTGH
ncbi:MAG: hypothetical protein ACT4QF_20235 [Sporichthyaceae bacterium]